MYRIWKAEVLIVSQMTMESGVKDKMYCSQCGAEIEANSRFCKHCGNKVDGGIALSNMKKNGSIDSVGVIRIILFLAVALILSFIELMFFGATISELLAGVAIAFVVASVIYVKIPKGIQGIGSILAFLVTFFVYIGIVGGAIDVEDSLPLFFTLVGIPLLLFNVIVLVLIASSSNKE